MAGMNLTRDEARERARLITVEDYRIELDLSGANADRASTFRSASTIRFRHAEPGPAATTFLDLVAPHVASVTLNGRALDPAEVYRGSRVWLTGLEATNEVTVDASCAYSRSGEGLHRFVDPADGRVYLYTQFEPADACRMYANFEQPDLKASFVFDITAPAGWHMSSNGTARERKRVVNGAARWVFAPTPRISTYITAVVAGPYQVERDLYSRELPDGTTLEIPLSALCRASLAEHFDADAIHEITKQGLDFFHERFDYPYPFGKYDQAFVPEYNLGAMENPGCVTLNEEYVFQSKVTDTAYEARACTILHEMAHMWFGDLVTMRWWDDLWLKESFAEFMGSYAQVEATAWKNAWISFANRRKAWAYRQDQQPTTHPIVATVNDLEDAKLNFDGITYAKGAAVLKQLVAYVGEEAFLEGARQYFKRHAFGNTTLTDLLDVLARTSGRDLAAWSRAWLETAQLNTLTIDEDTIVQSSASGYPQARPHRIAVGTYAVRTDGGRVVRTDRREVDLASQRTPFKFGTGDFHLLNDDDLTYAKLRLSTDQLAFLRERLSAFADPMARSLLWSALWNMTRDGELPGREFIAFVDRHAAAESQVGVVQNLLQQTETVLEFYLSPDAAQQAAGPAAAMAGRELAAAAPGSDHQLAWARGFAAIARSDADHTLLEALLDGSVSIDGLVVDADLRWTFLHALARGGRARQDDLDAQLVRDATAAGRRKHAGCMAARPTRDAKDAAWKLAVQSGDQPTDLLREVLFGFAATGGRPQLLRPFVEPYFAALDEVWKSRSIENASRIAALAFPSHVVEEATLDRADRWLDEDGHAPALRRLVLEARDDLRRALRARGAS
ncbi:aminopeptidase N [Actinocrinis puniceicyclus]|uniref:Aminopeptidase N n=1 Tax=Actinocrinis puniceicyclus TaxID=977794 RepID=A0A8J7WNV7_9ACTN|nr:aminopeptidase N [Actinocrinis puniceicyclus]MBS2965846.1 aminopeptidase N [Actinocrinis puniceicyclus]